MHKHVRHNTKTMKKSFEFGIQTLEFDSWKKFIEHINSNLDHRKFIWRGQGDSSWLLEPTLDRDIKNIDLKGINKTEIIERHLNRFKYASRGRRGLNPQEMKDDNDWWALGQHNGLSTPLLDWSKSPFVAAFFAFASSNINTTDHRIIFGVARTDLEMKSEVIKKAHKGKSRPPIIEFIEPLSDENARLVNQGGLFSRSPTGIDIESWCKENYKNEKKYIRVWKILLPEDERTTILQSLNRMNINYSSLFPDLFGSSNFSNMHLDIKHY